MPDSDQLTPAYERTQAASADQQASSALLSTAAAPAGFELRDEIGRGGMGIVYRALDLSLNREVAIKLLQDQFPAVGTTAARFLEEARITAQLQHPAIPAVYQVGVLPGGRPYLAMKLIKGDTLDRLLKARGETDAGCSRFIATFESIAQALAYAHSRRVIHRDLKPANIMVGAFGEVQVMDWGLAKVLGETAAPKAESDETTKIRSDRDSNAEGSTQYGQFMGTPAFMPPEQAIGAVDRIDERSDVFGLGAILCVILTGRPPFVGSDAETTRQLAARGKVEDAFVRLDACGAEPELIALAKRCLAVEPEDRPADAGELAAAIAAYRTSAEDRVKALELARVAGNARRRVLGRAAVAVFAVLAGGIGVSAWQAVRATQAEAKTAYQLKLTQDAEAKERAAREEADRQTAQAVADREKAERQEQIADERRLESLRQQLRAETVMQFLTSVLSQSNPWDQIGRGQSANPNMTIRDALDRAAGTLAGRFKDENELEARIRGTIGTTYFGIGLFAEAEQNLTRAVELLGAIYTDEELENDDLLLVLAKSLYKQGKFAKAEPIFVRAVAAREQAKGPRHLMTLTAIQDFANMRLAQGRPAEAEAMHRRVATALEKNLGADAQGTLSAWVQVADCLREQNRSAEAVPIYLRTIAGMETSLGVDHPNTLYAVNNLALVYEELGELDRAEPLYKRAIAGLEKRLGKNHDEPLISRMNLASFYRNAGRLDEAEAIAADVYATRHKLFGPKFPYTLYAANQLALVHKEKNQFERAEQLFREAIGGLKETVGPNHPETCECIGNLANLYFSVNRYADAEPLYQAVVTGREKHFGPDHAKTAFALNNLGTLREAQGRFEEGEALFRRAIPILDKSLGPTHRETLMSQFNLGIVLMDQNRNTDAEPWFRRAIAGRQKLFGPDHFQTLMIENWLAMCLEAQEKFAEVGPLLRRQLAQREREVPDSWLTANTRSRLGRALLDMGPNDEAGQLILRGFADLKARTEQIPLQWRGLRLHEAAERAVKWFELTDAPDEVRKWKAIAAEYRELAPAPRTRN